MNWRFSIITNVTTVLDDEPVGWDGVETNFVRNMITHGISTNISTESLDFVGDGFTALNNEYNAEGANGNAELLVEYECADGDGYSDYFRGKFDFNTLVRICAKTCKITCSVSAQFCADVFGSRMSQDVDVLSTTNFDGETITPMSYTTLNIEGQDVFVQDKANNNDGDNYMETITDTSGTTGNRFYDLPVLLPNTPVGEIGNWNVNNFSPGIISKNGGIDNISFPLPGGQNDFDNYFQFMYLYSPNNDECVSLLQVDWRCKGAFKLTPNYNGNATIILRAYRRNPIDNADFVDLGSVAIATATAISNGVQLTVNFDETFSGLPNQPLNGSYIVFAWHIEIFKSSASATDTTAINVDYDNSSVNYFNMSANSSCSATACQSVPLPDLLEWLPSAYLSTDCPSMEIETDLRNCLDRYAITKGSFLRNVTEPSTPKLFTNYEWMFEQCRKIFNIGWGFDNNETELKIARIDGFYKTNIVVNVGVVDMATFTTAQDLIYGTITVGYNKWEAEEYNGLDETNTQRQYRRNIDSNPTQLDLVADIISAGYTIEVARRKNQAKTGTSDWRYDDDIFIINTNTIDDVLYAYSGIDANAANVYSPSTRMNYALTPVRSLMRWFKSIAAARPTVSSELNIFTSGTGNYIAQGQMLYNCPIEGSTVGENETIDVSNFDNNYYIEPIWETIYATFNAPLSMAQFEAIKADVYGAIQFVCYTDIYVGNIVELNHDPNKGIASFKLLIQRQ